MTEETKQPSITCSVQGCSRETQARGWCKGHWQRWRDTGEVGSAEFRTSTHRAEGACAVDGCDRPAKTRGWCKVHYERQRIHGDVGPTEIHDGKRKSCRVAGCDRPAAAQVLCNTHYMRFRTKGDPGDGEIKAWSPQTGLCSVEACDLPAKTRGWCTGHYHRVIAHGNPGTSPIKPKVRTPCSVDGCDRDVNSGGLCGMHRRRMNKTGSTGDPAPTRRQAEFCTVDGCDEPSKTLSMCKTHYQRWYRIGTPTPVPRRVPRGGPDTPCAFPGCLRTIGGGAKGYCHTHHERFQARIRKFGSADIGVEDAYRNDRPAHLYLMKSSVKGGTLKIGVSVHIPTRKVQLRQGYAVEASWYLPTRDIAFFIESLVKAEWREVGFPPALSKGSEGYTETVLIRHVSQEDVISQVERLLIDHVPTLENVN